jgi:hypothetical protein
MKSIGRFRRFLIAGIAASLVVAALAGTKFGSKPVAAQVVAPVDVFMFHCSVIAGQPDYWALGTSHFTFTTSNLNFVQPSDCSQVIADALNAGYRLKSSLVLPNGGPGGSGATEYVLVRGGNQ